MRVLIAGDWHSEIHEEPVYQALRALGHEPIRFPWFQYFQPALQGSGLRYIDLFVRKLQNKFIAGPLIEQINRDLLTTVRDVIPHLLLVYRGTHITADTLRAIKYWCPSITIAGLNNDNPFSPGHPYRLWRHFLDAIPEYDVILAYRRRDLEEYRKAGAQKVHLLRSWYVPEYHYPVTLTEEDRKRYECDVVFVGHYESDGRKEVLEAIVRNGFRLRLFGPEWNRVVHRSPELRSLSPVEPVWGDEYTKALCGAKVALCLLSKLNRDTYTRRCFEIPATKTMMLSEYSAELATLFREGVEAEFFRSEAELIEKLKRYIKHDEARKSVAEAGYRRVILDGHGVHSRMKELLAATKV